MSDATTAPAAPDTPRGEEWLGHPKGLFYLFFAEMWERFCFYGMRNILVLYMVKYFMYSDDYAQGGVYAAYTSLVYCAAIFGGYMADRYLGYRRSIMYGGILMALGEFMLLLNQDVAGYVGMSLSKSLEELFFFGGMATIIVGNGFFKPNISTIVGKLYGPGDRRRDAGFTIFYMGINVGALVGGLACAWVGENISWPLGFGLAGVGMLLGVFTFGTKGCTRSLHGHGDPSNPETMRRSFPVIVLGSVVLIPIIYLMLQRSQVVGWILLATFIVVFGILFKTALSEEKAQRERIFALIILVIFNVAFWTFFEQAGSSLTLFADRNLDRGTPFGTIPAGWPQNFNPFFIIALAPVFAALWLRMGKRGVEPSIPAKFVLGLLQLGVGFGVLVLGAKWFATDGITPMVFLVLLYLLATTGELCLSPVGLSMVTKLAPARMTGMVMGAWFLSISSANFLAGQVAAMTGAEEVSGVLEVKLEEDSPGAEIARWLIEAEDPVEKDQPVLEITTDAGPQSITAPEKGTVLGLSLDVGAAVATGDVLLEIETMPPSETLPIYTGVYKNSAWFIFGVTLLLLLLVPVLKKWMHGVT